MISIKPKIIPHLWFDTQAKEAVEFYCSIFPDSKISHSVIIKDTPSGDAESISFTLSGQPFMAISAGPFFKFCEAISFVVYCETQDEIDYYWENLSADPLAEQCGWLKDKFGLSWQIVPTIMAHVMRENDPTKTAQVTKAFLSMKKFNIKAIQQAYEDG